jgi:hypothetical protein
MQLHNPFKNFHILYSYQVIASGDLTDAKDPILGSEQFPEEWQAYFQTLTETGVINKTKWLDLRGNHDNFNVQVSQPIFDIIHTFCMHAISHSSISITRRICSEIFHHKDVFTSVRI